ncbi:hypothetical protein EMIT0194P_160153 [Pseudomonas serbica]
MILSLVSGYRLPAVLLGCVLLVGVGCAGGIWLPPYRLASDRVCQQAPKRALQIIKCFDWSWAD